VALILTKAYENKKPITLPDDGRPQWTAVDIEMPATALASGDLILAATIPIGFEVIDYFITSPDCDSGGSALAVSIGVALADLSDLGTGTKVWGTSITAFATGVPFRNALNACQADPKTTNRVVALKCTTIATTYDGSGKTGKLMLLLQG